MTKKRFPKKKVFFLNPRTCGIYKNGGTRYKVDEHGVRGAEVDNELLQHVLAFISGKKPDGSAEVPTKQLGAGVLVPRYYDGRWNEPFNELKKVQGFDEVTIGELLDQGILTVRGGHGSPSNDQRIGEVPYIKVSDIRNLRLNINPTNLVPLALAKRLWRSPLGDSGLKAWDVITPNRASNNIGEFALLLPGEEQVVLTKEVFIFRVCENVDGWDPFYLFWALCLKAVRQQWQRVALMQTNREDVGNRYREIRLPYPQSPRWAAEMSEPFRDYFTTVAESKAKFRERVQADDYGYIASVFSDTPPPSAEEAGVN
ncbi:MAG: hypothetical protein NT087_13760 [Deltaproteobacteria bacterium]|nr:hypothetical protein [Deltaproteobacteria bacterium]